MANPTTVLQPGADGSYALGSVARADISRIDLSDVDLVVTTKDGGKYLLPGGGISAMGDHPPAVHFSDGTVSVDQLLSEVGAAVDLVTEVPMPSSLKQDAAKEGAKGKEQELAQHVQKLEHQSHDQQQKIQQQQDQIKKLQQQAEQHKHDIACGPDDKKGGDQKDEDCAPKKPDNPNVGSLAVDTEGTVEQMVMAAQKIEDDLHKSDYDYVPPQQYAPIAAPPTPPPGVPPPISLTPIVTLFMGNVTNAEGYTIETVNGVTYYLGGGGASNSGADASLSPRDALQWSADTINLGNDTNNDVIYADGELVGNTNINPGTINTAYYAKEFLLNVAGYFTSLNNITIKDVPAGVTITNATYEGGGVWSLPASSVLKQIPFDLVYNTANYVPGGNNTFTIEVDISGQSSHGSTFSSVTTYEFEYMPVTNSNQVTNPTLVYDAGGFTKEIYVLPTLQQPNDITAGSGDDTVYGSESNDIITLGDGNDVVVEGDGNNTITVGDGQNPLAGDNISAGNGNNVINVVSPAGNTSAEQITLGDGNNTINGGDGYYTIAVGAGVDTIAIGAGNSSITTAGGGGSITTGSGNQSITINSAGGSKNNYNITTSGSGNTTLAAGDNNYAILANNTGLSTLSIGSGTSIITAADGIANITTGNGIMTIAAGAGAGDSLNIGGNGSASAANTIIASLGNGAGDSITTNGSSASTGTLAIGSGNGDQINLDSGSYTVTIGGSTGTTNTLLLTSGTGNTISSNGGNGNDTIYVGSGGSNSISLPGNGNNTVYVGTGTDTINAGSGNNILNFNSIGSALAITLTSTGAGTATGTNVSDTFSGFGTIYGTNYGDTINMTLAAQAMTIYAGTGNDNITLGTGVDTVYAGNGNNTISGSNITAPTGDMLYGGTGNNTFNSPNAGTTYNGTNGQALAIDTVPNTAAPSITNTDTTNPFTGTTTAVTTPTTVYSSTNSVTGATDTITYTYGSGAATIAFNTTGQVNEVNYASTSTTALTINLATGSALGGNGVNGNAGSSVYFSYAPGYSSIDAIVGNNGSDVFTPSYDNTIFIGGAGANTFQDSSTSSSQTNILIGNGTTAGSGTDNFYMGAASEIIVASTHNTNQVLYGYSSSLAAANNSAGVVVNFDSVNHTFDSAGGAINVTSTSSVSSALTVNAYSGSNWGAADSNAATGNYALSWSTGDYFVPVAGTSTDINTLFGSNYYTNLVYGGSNHLTYYAGGSSSLNPLNGNFFYAGSGGSTYAMNGGLGVAVAPTPSASATNILLTYNNAYNNSGYNMVVVLNQSLDTSYKSATDAAVSLTYDDVANNNTAYSGFVYGWNNTTTPTAGAITYTTNYEDIATSSGNDYIVGDNLGDQINAGTGTNIIIMGNGANVITAISGSNKIWSSTATAIGTHNILNFETTSTVHSWMIGGSSVVANGTAAMGQYSGSSASSVEAFLDYSSTTQSTFFNSGVGDANAFMGSSIASIYEVTTGSGNSIIGAVNNSTTVNSTVTQFDLFQTINGSDYGVAAAYTNLASTAASTVTDSTFTLDNVYSGAQTIIGEAGNDVFIDNIGTAAETFYNAADRSNIYYITGTQIADVSITGGGTSVIDILRIEGATAANVATLASTVAAHSSEYTGIDVLDIRNGTDTVSGTTVTMGVNSTTTSNTYTITSAMIDSLVSGNSSTPSTLVLKLDNGDTLANPTGTVSTSTAVSGNTTTTSYYNSATQSTATLIATDAHNTTLYYSDILTYKSNGTTIGTLDVHHGTG